MAARLAFGTIQHCSYTAMVKKSFKISCICIVIRDHHRNLISCLQVTQPTLAKIYRISSTTFSYPPHWQGRTGLGPLALPFRVKLGQYFQSDILHNRCLYCLIRRWYIRGALVAVWQCAGFAIGRLRVRISAWATSHQGLLSLPSFRGR